MGTTTRSPLTFDSAVPSSSDIPSAKYASAVSGPTFENGSTAIDCGTVASPRASSPVRRLWINATPTAAMTSRIATTGATRRTVRRDMARKAGAASPAPVITASRTWRISRADCGRVAGFFSRQRMTIVASARGQSAHFKRISGGRSARCAASNWCAGRRPNGGSPDISSNARQPNE